MREEYLYTNFPAGLITDRIVLALSRLPIRAFLKLTESKKLNVPEGAENTVLQSLTYRNLKWNCIDDYAEACNVPLCRLIYGEESAPKTAYSYYDHAVIPLLNILEPEVLLAATEVLCASYYNPLFSISKDCTPSEKLLHILFNSTRSPVDVPAEQLTKYNTNINQELERYRSVRLKDRFVFHIDYILDLCAYLHISPHFVFSLGGNLLCKSPEGDAFFDLFCLLSRPQQVTVIAMLASLCPQASSMLDGELWQSILRVISEEGGIVTWH